MFTSVLFEYTVEPQSYIPLGNQAVRNCEKFISLKQRCNRGITTGFTIQMCPLTVILPNITVCVQQCNGEQVLLYLEKS